MKRVLYIAGMLGVGVVVYMIGEGCRRQQNNCCCPSSNCCSSVKDDVKDTVKQAYAKVAQGGDSCSLFGGGCCGGGSNLSGDIGYSKEELEALSEANLGLGCGNPVSLGEFKEGFTVLDLGSGAGLDCFLAAKKVGASGMVIGVDMTPEMIKKARENAQKYAIENVEFRQGDIENLPIASNTIDIIMSNCVINLAPDKDKVFKEAYRVLKQGGKMYVSDVVLLGDLSQEQKKDTRLLCACVSGALLKDIYLAKLKQVGFDIEIVGEDKEINKKWFKSDELPISSLKFIAIKK
jgi:arsenite methyltransferase